MTLDIYGAMNTADKLTMLLEKRGFRVQKEFARRLGVSQQTLNNWIVGKRMPEREHLIRLARELAVTVDYLIDDNQVEIPGDPLSEDDRMILKIARKLGHDFSIDVLLANAGQQSSSRGDPGEAPATGARKSGGMTPVGENEVRKPNGPGSGSDPAKKRGRA